MKGMDFLWVGLIVLAGALLALVVWQTAIEQPIAEAKMKSSANSGTGTGAKAGG